MSKAFKCMVHISCMIKQLYLELLFALIPCACARVLPCLSLRCPIPVILLWYRRLWCWQLYEGQHYHNVIEHRNNIGWGSSWCLRCLLVEFPKPLHLLTRFWWACLSWSWVERCRYLDRVTPTLNHPIIFHTLPHCHSTRICPLRVRFKRRWASLLWPSMKCAFSFK